MRSTAVAFDANSDNWRVLKEEEEVRNVATTSLFNERTLKLKSLLIPDDAQSPDFKRLGHERLTARSENPASNRDAGSISRTRRGD